MTDQQERCAAISTDRELYREPPGDYYADRLFVTEGGGIGIDCGGYVIVKPLKDWHALSRATIPQGMRMVPVEPTLEMRQAALIRSRESATGGDLPLLPQNRELYCAELIYDAMLAAAPQQPDEKG